jgi:hypothetical protein
MIYCDYLGRTYRRRPCSYLDCTVFEPKKQYAQEEKYDDREVDGDTVTYYF